LRLVFENWLREQNVQLLNTMQIESNEVIRMSVENGLGLAVLSEHTLAQSQARVAQINVRDFPLNSHWYLVRHGDRRLPITARNFIDFMTVHLGEWIEEKYIHNELGVLVSNR
jgi:DNA-binding transcriptional LysR family regulator